MHWLGFILCLNAYSDSGTNFQVHSPTLSAHTMHITSGLRHSVHVDYTVQSEHLKILHTQVWPCHSIRNLIETEHLHSNNEQ